MLGKCSLKKFFSCLAGPRGGLGPVPPCGCQFGQVLLGVFPPSLRFFRALMSLLDLFFSSPARLHEQIWGPQFPAQDPEGKGGLAAVFDGWRIPGFVLL